eukprot:gene25488-biopygen19950
MSEAPPQEAAGSPEALSNPLPHLLLALSTTALLDLPTQIIDGILDILLIQNPYFLSRRGKKIKDDQILSLRLSCSLFNNLVLARATKMAFNGTVKQNQEFSSLPVRLLQTLPNLQVLDLKQCQKSPLSLVGLPTTLTTLSLCGTATNQNKKSYPLLDLSPLSKCIGLKTLDISSSKKRVADISPLSACQCLDKLNIRQCVALTSLSPLAHCNNLRSLNLRQTKISDLSPLSACVELAKVDCSRTKVSNISPLSACLKLEEVNCLGTSVKDISNLAACPQLIAIECDKDVIGLKSMI